MPQTPSSVPIKGRKRCNGAPDSPSPLIPMPPQEAGWSLTPLTSFSTSASLQPQRRQLFECPSSSSSSTYPVSSAPHWHSPSPPPAYSLASPLAPSLHRASHSRGRGHRRHAQVGRGDGSWAQAGSNHTQDQPTKRQRID